MFLWGQRNEGHCLLAKTSLLWGEKQESNILSNDGRSKRRGKFCIRQGNEAAATEVVSPQSTLFMLVFHAKFYRKKMAVF